VETWHVIRLPVQAPALLPAIAASPVQTFASVPQSASALNDDLVLLHNFELGGLFRLLLRLLARGSQSLLHSLLDREIQFALGIVQFTLFPEQIGLCFLRLGQLRVTLFKNLVEIGDFFVLLVYVVL